MSKTEAMPNDTPHNPKQVSDDWEERFDIEFSADIVVHVYETEQFKKIKEFMRHELEQARKEGYQEGLKLLFEYNYGELISQIEEKICKDSKEFIRREIALEVDRELKALKYEDQNG